MTLAELGGRKVMDFGGSTDTTAYLDAIPQGKASRAVAVLVNFANWPSGTSPFFATTNPAGANAGIGMRSPQNAPYLYGNNSPTIQSSTPGVRNAWMAIVGSFNNETKIGKICAGGAVDEGSITYAVGVTPAMRIQGTSVLSPKYLDVALFDRDLSNAEMQTVAAALLSQVSA